MTVNEYPSGAEQIGQERALQIGRGYDAEHDDAHIDGEITTTAAQILLYQRDEWGLFARHEDNRIRQLRIAGALVAAEIDRLMRLRAQP